MYKQMELFPKEFNPIEEYAKLGSSTSGGKERIKDFFEHNKNLSERIGFLKKEYGAGGFGSPACRRRRVGDGRVRFARRIRSAVKFIHRQQRPESVPFGAPVFSLSDGTCPPRRLSQMPKLTRKCRSSPSCPSRGRTARRRPPTYARR